MITCDIGTNGRFGNQMFQYAALYGIAKKRGFEFGINYKLGDNVPWSEFGVDNTYCKLTINKPFDLSAKHCESHYSKIHENPNDFHFQTAFFNISDNVKIHGYFQSEKYFAHCRDDIRKEFTFKPEIVDVAKNFLSDKSTVETVSIHVRRGDYVKLTHHGVCPIEYYNKSIQSHFSDKPHNYIVITDDIDWAKSTFSHGNNFFISESKNQFVDMCLMSLCNHNIIANSSFGWWGSWLNINSNKKVIAPAVWFREGLKGLNTSDLYLSNWTIM